MFFALGLVFFGLSLLIVGLLMLVQALVHTELQMAHERLKVRDTAVSKRDDEFETMRLKHDTLLDRINELEDSRQDLFNYVMKQEKMIEKLRSQPHSAVKAEPNLSLEASQNNGSPQD